MGVFMRLLAHKPMPIGMVGVQGKAWREAVNAYEDTLWPSFPYRRPNRQVIKASRLSAWKARKKWRAAARKWRVVDRATT